MTDSVNDGSPLAPLAQGWNRRQFLGLGGAVTLGGVLAGCSANPKSKSPAISQAVGSISQAVAQPKRGGTLTFGCQGGTSSDTLDAHNALQATDFARTFALYDGLARLDNAGRVKLHMAKSVTPSENATQWTIAIHDGITTHTGKPFTAKDVLFSLRRIIHNNFPGAVTLGPIDLTGSKVVNPTTLVVKYSKPYSELLDALSGIWCLMVPEAFDPKKPDGTGPFVFKSFTPGVSSSFERNSNYWSGPGPYLDKLVITNINDETAQVNALQSGQVDVVNFLSAASAGSLRSSGAKLYEAKTGSAGTFTMRMDIAPFKDNRVRQAMKLIVDRPQMIKQVFGGYGSLGNDIFGRLDPLSDTSIPQTQQDLAKAKSLLASAGYSDLKAEIVTCPNGPGQTQAAQVFATQAKAAGVDVRVVVQTTTDWFAKSFKQTPFGQDYWYTGPYLITVGQALGPGAPFNEPHQNDPEYNALYARALRTTAESTKRDLVHQMQRIEHDRGGTMIPYYLPSLDASTAKIHGIQPSATGLAPGGLYWADFWKDS